MFKTAPKQVEESLVEEAPVKKGRKNKELAFEHFEKSVSKNETSIATIEVVLKMQDATVVEMRKKLREALRDAKEVRKYLGKFKNIQYKPKRVRVFHNTGLEKLRPISRKMAMFVDDWEYDSTQKSRYDVTNILCAYIKEHSLQDPSNGTIIVPDAKLRELLQVEDDVVLKYPTMQKYLKNCFEEVVAEPDGGADKDDIKRGRKPKEPKEPTKKEEKKAKKTGKKESKK